ncbi:hypothetical protein TPA0905_60250 [Streptomyces olivaceus]|nr:hypothetical protein TPA0905_60250 [Streptomyces olivaceus]
MPGELAKPVGTGKNRQPTARHGPATGVVTEHDTPPPRIPPRSAAASSPPLSRLPTHRYERSMTVLTIETVWQDLEAGLTFLSVWPGLNVAQLSTERQGRTGVRADFRPNLNECQPFLGMDTYRQRA